MSGSGDFYCFNKDLFCISARITMFVGYWYVEQATNQEDMDWTGHS